MDSTSANEAAAPSIVVHSSVRGLVAAVATPLALGLLGARSLAVAGPTAGSVGFIGVAVFLALLVAVHVPRHTVFDSRGVTRVCIIRRQRLPWHRVTAIERTRPTGAATLRNLGGDPGEFVISGGLVARSGGLRRWLLTDQIESRAEYDRIDALLRAHGIPVDFRAPRPHETAVPTDLYRPRRR